MVLLSKNVQNMSTFFTEIVGLRLIHLMPCGSFAELRDTNGFSLQIRQATGAHLQYGYAPILNFEIHVNEDLDALLKKACNSSEYQCHMDGEIIADDYLKIACVKIEEQGGTGGGGPTIALMQKL